MINLLFNFKDKVKTLVCQGFECRMSDLCYVLSDSLHGCPQITQINTN